MKSNEGGVEGVVHAAGSQGSACPLRGIRACNAWHYPGRHVPRDEAIESRRRSLDHARALRVDLESTATSRGARGGKPGQNARRGP